ncbi:MAG: tetratricopeptide repeat protein [Bacteroidaceae bacterium]|nr:tetratricopeptide repeat protein [Bacteroidaceae bacterium]
MDKDIIRAMIEAMTKELDNEGPNANILKERGRLKMLLGDKKGAMDDLRKAIALDPTIIDTISGEFRK